MPLQNFQYDTIMREYSRRQSEVQRALEERRKEAYTRVPRLLEIDQEVASLSARKARALLLGQPASIEELREEVAALANERISLLKANGFPADYQFSARSKVCSLQGGNVTNHYTGSLRGIKKSYK